MKDPKAFTVFVAQLAEAKRPPYNGAFDLARDAEAFCTIAKRLDRIHVNQCNGYPRFDPVLGHNVEDTARAEREENREAALKSAATILATKYSFDAVHFQDDPRGWPIYLGYAPHMTANNYSTQGIGVPPL